MLHKKEDKKIKLREIIKDHIENSQVMDTIKDYITNDKNLTDHDKTSLMKKLKTEGVLSHVLRSLPISKLNPDKKVVAGIRVKKSAGGAIPHKELLDKNKKYVI